MIGKSCFFERTAAPQHHQGKLFMATNDTDSDTTKDMIFWANNKQTLPHRFTVVSDVVLLQLSSAFMEGVFSILRCCFLSEKHEKACGDRVCGSLLLMYNHAKDRDGLELSGGGDTDS